MKKVLYLANIKLDANEGILKKVYAQAQAMSKVVGECCVVTRCQSGTLYRIYFEGALQSEEIKANSYFAVAKDMIERIKPEYMYIRLMIPSFGLCSTINKAKKKNAKVFYEIPTYPYWGEQYKAATNKIKPIIKIMLDIFFAIPIYSKLDKLVFIRSNSRSRVYSKMVEIVNGVEVAAIKEKEYGADSHENVIRFVGVGTIYGYHGYDRFLKGLSRCKETYNGKTIETHIVGNSPTINALKEISSDLKLQNVYFDGVKTTEELNAMYDTLDIGLGCLALHRRNADIDTTLKIVEYFCRGVPVVTSGKTFMKKIGDYSPVISVPDGEEPIDVSLICSVFESMPVEKLKLISTEARKIYDWESIMRGLFID